MGLPMAVALRAAGPVVAYDAAPAAAARAPAAGRRRSPTRSPTWPRSCNTVLLSLPVRGGRRGGGGRARPGRARAAGARHQHDRARRRPAHRRRSRWPPGRRTSTPRCSAAPSWSAAGRCRWAARQRRTPRWRRCSRRSPRASSTSATSGAAATLKVANNLMFSVINAVTAEALLLAQAAGLDPGVFVDTVVDSGAATVSGLFRSIAPRAVDGDFAPTFSLDLVRKDNDLAVQLAPARPRPRGRRGRPRPARPGRRRRPRRRGLHRRAAPPRGGVRPGGTPALTPVSSVRGMAKKKWSDLTPSQQRAVKVGGAIEAVMTVAALRDLARRPAEGGARHEDRVDVGVLRPALRPDHLLRPVGRR